MWEVYEHRRAAKRLDRLPKEVLKRYEKWKDIVRISGPDGLRLIKGFHDEPQEIGRAPRLNSSHLVISYAVFCLKKKKATRQTSMMSRSRTQSHGSTAGVTASTGSAM